MYSQLGQYSSQQGNAHALNIYNYPGEFRSFRVMGMRYLLTHYRSIHNPPPKNLLFQRCLEMLEEFHRNRDRTSLFEMADIINTFSPDEELRERCLNIIREYDNPPQVHVVGLQNRMGVEPRPLEIPKKDTIYDDSQNVHNTKINQSVITAIKALFRRYKDILRVEENQAKHINSCLDNVREILVGKYPVQRQVITESVEYVKRSTASFYGIGISEVFLSIWLWISEQKSHIPELEQRFIEEMKEMKGYCTTGHLARLVNVIQGYTEDEELCIRISDKDQCKAVVRHHLSEELRNCKDEKVLEGIIGDDKTAYVKFIRQAVSKKLIEWKKDYGEESLEDIAELVNDFCRTKVFQ